MKKLSKILKWLSILLLIRMLFSIFCQIKNLICLADKEEFIYQIMGIKFPSNISDIKMWFYNIVLLLLLFYASYLVYTFIKISNSLHKNLLFIDKNAKQLQNSAIGIIIFTTFLILIKYPLHLQLLLEKGKLVKSVSYYSGYTIGHLTTKNIFLYIIALFLLIVSKLIKKGAIIKQENDLTI